MNFIKPHPPANITFELQLNVPLCLIILPNPSRTNTEMEENLMYVGDTPCNALFIYSIILMSLESNYMFYLNM